MFPRLFNKLLHSLANFSGMASSQSNFLLQIFLNNRRVYNTKGGMTPKQLENIAEILKTFRFVNGSFMTNSHISQMKIETYL